MESRNLITFLKVAETKNFSKAASLLGYSQSAVTAQIHQLEAELGVRVFDRLGKTIALTEAGRTYLTYAQQILALEETAKHSVQTSPVMSGDVRIGIAESLCICFLPNILHDYRSQYPEVNLIIKPAYPRTMFQQLQNNDLDLVYTLDRQFQRNDLISPRQLAEPIHFIAPAGHPLTKESSVTIDALLNESFILTDCGISYRDELDHRLAVHNKKIQPFLEVGNTDVICQLVAKGVGLSFVPSYAAAPYVNNGSISFLKIDDFQIYMFRQFIYHKDKWLTPPIEAMIHLLMETDFKNE